MVSGHYSLVAELACAASRAWQRKPWSLLPGLFRVQVRFTRTVLAFLVHFQQSLTGTSSTAIRGLSIWSTYDIDTETRLENTWYKISKCVTILFSCTVYPAGLYKFKEIFGKKSFKNPLMSKEKRFVLSKIWIIKTKLSSSYQIRIQSMQPSEEQINELWVFLLKTMCSCGNVYYQVLKYVVFFSTTIFKMITLFWQSLASMV